ncbi:MAG: NrfD/PsrC family molybdoenzyme membrane anchor subunit, partial [bacterium]
FHYIFTRPQWKSWLVRGAFIIAAYSFVLALHFLTALMGRPDLQAGLVVPGALLAAMTAVYTGYLFAQAKARDLWQNPLLPPHFLLQAALAGAAALVPLASWLEPDLVRALLWVLGGASLLHVLMVAGELTLTHATAHAHLAATEMLAGRYRTAFWVGALLAGVGILAPWIGPLASVAALAGLLAYEHAYVQSGQSVPLA